MPMKGSGQGEVTVVDRFDGGEASDASRSSPDAASGGGVGWIAFPDEAMQRASHAVESDGQVWVFDPVDGDGVDDLLAEFDADVGGVVLGLARHQRDAATVAERHDVAVHVPAWMTGVAGDIDAPIERFEHELADFAVERLFDNTFWKEAVFFDGETLVVPEAVGTVEFFRSTNEVLGVHPMLRMLPPRSLRQYDPERILVGHGEGVFEDAGSAIRDAIDGSRTRAPSVYLRNLKAFLPF